LFVGRGFLFSGLAVLVELRCHAGSSAQSLTKVCC